MSAHAEDARGHAFRVEDLQGVGFFTGAREEDGSAGDGTHRQRRAAAGITVELGQDDAAQPETAVKTPATFTASCPVIASTTSRM